jgi:hypothetical protein
MWSQRPLTARECVGFALLLLVIFGLAVLS